MSDIRCPLCQQKNKALDSPKIPKSLKKFQNFPLATPLITCALLLRSGVNHFTLTLSSASTRLKSSGTGAENSIISPVSGWGRASFHA